jgi:hypothetical protein
VCMRCYIVAETQLGSENDSKEAKISRAFATPLLTSPIVWIAAAKRFEFAARSPYDPLNWRILHGHHSIRRHHHPRRASEFVGGEYDHGDDAAAIPEGNLHGKRGTEIAFVGEFRLWQNQK